MPPRFSSSQLKTLDMMEQRRIRSVSACVPPATTNSVRGSLAARLRGRKMAQAFLRFHCEVVCRAKGKANRCRSSCNEAAGVNSHFCWDGAGSSAGNWSHSLPTLVLHLKEDTACSREKWNRIQGLII